MPSNVQQVQRTSQHPARSAVLRLESRRSECLTLLADITPGSPHRYQITGHWHRSGVSRARGGQHCPIHRAVVLLEALRQAGRPREDAERVLAYLAGVVDGLWPLAEIDYIAAHITKAGHHADEYYYQIRIVARIGQVSAAELRVYRDALGKQLAAGRVLYAATERLIEEREADRRWSARAAKGWAT